MSQKASKKDPLGGAAAIRFTIPYSYPLYPLNDETGNNAAKDRMRIAISSTLLRQRVLVYTKSTASCGNLECDELRLS